MDRRARVLVTAAVLGALVAPVLVDQDDYPLSTYPMYARARGDTVMIVTAQAVTPDGATSPLTLGVVGQSDDPLIVAGELRAAIRTGRADARCAEIAVRASEWNRWPPEATAVEIVTEWRNAVAHVSGEDSLETRRVHARCEVAS